METTEWPIRAKLNAIRVSQYTKRLEGPPKLLARCQTLQSEPREREPRLFGAMPRP